MLMLWIGMISPIILTLFPSYVGTIIFATPNSNDIEITYQGNIGLDFNQNKTSSNFAINETVFIPYLSPLGEAQYNQLKEKANLNMSPQVNDTITPPPL